MMRDFDKFAPYYDAEFGDFDEDIPLYLNFARRTGGPVLELGCGTGRVLLPLAQAGYSVVGVDISGAMLARARTKARRAGVARRVALLQADVTHLALGRPFPLIIYAANSFMHHTTQGEQREVLLRIRDHLRPGGLVILDLFNPDIHYLSEHTGRVELVRRWEEENGTTVLKFQAVRAFPDRQLLDVTNIYERNLGGGCVERVVAPFQLRYLWPDEIPLLLEVVGLELEALYGSYDLEPVGEDTPRLIVVARRR